MNKMLSFSQILHPLSSYGQHTTADVINTAIKTGLLISP